MVFSDYKRTLGVIVASTWMFLFFYSKNDTLDQQISMQHRPFLPRPKPAALDSIQIPEVISELDTGQNQSVVTVSPTNEPFTDNATEPKKILFFTSFFDQSTWGFGAGGPELFKRKGCHVSNCVITDNKTQFGSMADFDAILFHMRNLNSKTGIPNQKKRKPNQSYVMMILESPMHDSINYEGFADFFNWTMTYRSDSDLPIPYGRILPLNSTNHDFHSRNDVHSWKPFNYTEFHSTLHQRPAEFLELAQRPKLVAWIVSNCHTNSERELYVKELSKHINVTIFGGCGLEKCQENCDQIVQTNYKFFLSFENSICHEYVTEKFFKRINQSMLPIVMGGSNYSKIAPPHSYIDIRDFKSPEMLAKYLWYLDKNHEEYLSYFWWKYDYSVKLRYFHQGICDLCQMLNMNLPAKSYHNMTSWWRADGSQGPACQPKGTFPWSESKLDSIKSQIMRKMDSFFHVQ